MKPENHAIRQLEKQLETAKPEHRELIEVIILDLKACLLNANDMRALAHCQRKLAESVEALREKMF